MLWRNVIKIKIQKISLNCYLIHVKNNKGWSNTRGSWLHFFLHMFFTFKQYFKTHISLSNLSLYQKLPIIMEDSITLAIFLYQQMSIKNILSSPFPFPGWLEHMRYFSFVDMPNSDQKFLKMIYIPLSDTKYHI